MNQFYDSFRRLPAEAQEQVISLLGQALKWRGWDKLSRKKGPGRIRSHAEAHVDDIAKVFLDNGQEVEEYT